MKKLIIIGILLLGLALPGLAQDVVTPGMSGLQTRNALNTAFSELLGVVDTVNETIRVGGVQITANATEINTVLDGALVNVTELNRLVGIPGNIVTLLAGKENSLGNPSVDGYVPSKSTTGVVTWIAPGTGGANYPSGSGIPLVVAGASWGTTITDNSTDWNAAWTAVESAGVGVMAPDSTEASELNYLPWHSAKKLNEQMYNPLLRELRMLGADMVAIPVGAAQLLASYTNLTENRAYYVATYLNQDTTITGVKWLQRVQGVYTADNYNGVALYSLSGTALTQVAISTDDGDCWKGSAYTLQTKAFSSPYSATKGMYYVAFLYNTSAETQAPSIYDWNIISSISQLVTGGNKVSGYVGTQNTLPATETAGDMTADGQLHGVWLY